MGGQSVQEQYGERFIGDSRERPCQRRRGKHIKTHKGTRRNHSANVFPPPIPFHYFHHNGDKEQFLSCPPSEQPSQRFVNWSACGATREAICAGDESNKTLNFCRLAKQREKCESRFTRRYANVLLLSVNVSKEVPVGVGGGKLQEERNRQRSFRPGGRIQLCSCSAVGGNTSVDAQWS
ncbi:hypothetical protein F2P81_010043 [Scophthalmus maximus]|uniref:Uncharacterized protein n=1 Tax=Scophthalmus maximus TaxID=52904 RepID=A0A6A4SWT8_SCOMX|nr:hypothetical protein F2P81_010043 [Scophthalmus maximus]